MLQDIPTGRDLKLVNRNNIYKLIWREKRISKQGILQKLEISLPTVTQNLNKLVEEGLVEANGTFRYTGGRSAVGYSIVQDARLAVGVDLNKTHFAVVILDLNGEILYSYHEHCKFENNHEYCERVARNVQIAMDKTKVTRENLLGIGISIQGLVSQDHQKVIYGPILGITGMRVEQIAKCIPYPCELFHDADSAAFAELWVSPDVCDVVYVALSTNLGGSLIINRKIFNGENYMAGKLEHMTLVPNGEQCYCGEKGCAEVYCRASNISDYAPDGKLNTFFAMLEAGDDGARKTWNTYVDKLIILLNSLHMLMDTDVILGGYMATYLEPYLQEIKQKAYVRNKVDTNHDYIHLARFTTEAIAAGSALRFIDQFVNNV